MMIDAINQNSIIGIGLIILPILILMIFHFVIDLFMRYHIDRLATLLVEKYEDEKKINNEKWGNDYEY